MKKLFTGIIILTCGLTGFSQNDAVMAAPLGTVISPVTGCALTNAETVTIRIFNAGPGTINAPFDVSYNITGPIPSTATETVLVGSILSNSTFTYSFTTTADLSAIGVYTMDASVTVLGDPNLSNNTYVGYGITNNASSNGGTATGGGNICSGSNSGNITLVGSVGNVLNWEYSTDMGLTWVNISNTTTSQSYNNLTVQTWYRANVQNASCPVATSSIAQMIIDPVTVGGVTSGGATPACSGLNSGIVTLSGKVGNVIHWETSTDGGSTWTVVPNTTTSFSYSNITITTRFRALVQSGVCPPSYSSQRIIVVNAPTVGGTINTAATVCSGANSGNLTLVGYNGTIVHWQYSTDGGSTWTVIANTTPNQTYLNLTQTTDYRARVVSSPCAFTYSGITTITVVSNSVGGTINSNQTVCELANEDTLVLTGFNGTVLDWENSVDGGLTWLSTGVANDSLIYLNLTQNTTYRAIVQAGTCPTANSSTVTVSVDGASVGGNLSSDNTVCASSNAGTVNLAGETGTILNWEFSDDLGATWNSIANASPAQNYTNLSTTTWYRTNVQNGTCPAEFSDTVTITVDPVSVGGTVNSNAVLCAGSNTGVLNLVGETGSVTNWESSTDGGFTWLSIANITTSQPYNNIATNTQFRAIVKSGLCSATQSGIATLTVDQPAIGGTIFGSTTVCEGINSGTLTSLGSNGMIQDWESSTDGGLTWNPLGNSSSVENFNNLLLTTDYRVILANGVCPNDTSTLGTVTVDATTIPGAVSSDAIVCQMSNSDVVTLSGHNGTILNWEMSNDGGSTWLTLANTSTAQNYFNLNASTSYRAKVKNGVCPSLASAPANITVNSMTVPGAVNSSTTVCEGLNFGTLSLTGHSGIIINWEFSNNNGATWTTIANTTTNQNYTNLVDTTWYRAIVQSGICPQDTSAIAFINLYPSPNADFIATSTCSNDAASFVNTTSSTSGFVTLNSWDFGDGNSSTALNPTHTYANAGVYTTVLFVMNNFGCTDTASYNTTVFASPIASITANGATSFCAGDSVELAAVSDVNYTYSWNNGAVSNIISVDSTYNYVLTVTDITSLCTSQDSINVIVFSAPTADAGLDTSVALGFTTVLTGSGGVLYSWSPSADLDNANAQFPIAKPTGTTTYVLVVTDINNCVSSDSVVVSLTGEEILNIRNIITPNGDGYNDVWHIENILNFPNNNVSVFNRYGQKVYEGTNYVNDWGGTYNGDLLPDGSYYYVVELTDTGKVFKGAINIVKSDK